MKSKKTGKEIRPDYSVLMSVYKNDVTECVKEAVESMLNQTLPCEQFVIVEDGPVSEALENLICSYESSYPEIFTIVRLKKNGGLGNALNQGLKYCRNELTARMDADDISVPERCEKQIRVFCENASLSIVGGQIHEFTGNPGNIVSSRIVPADLDGIKKFAKRRSPFNHVTVMFRKSAVQAFRGYVSYSRKEDLELFIRMINNGIQAVNIDEPLVLVRISDESMGRRKSWTNCKEYIDIMYKFYKQGYLGISDMMYVFFGQIAMYILPKKLAGTISTRLLRNKLG